MPEVFELTIEPWPAGGVDAFEQRALDVELLDDASMIQSASPSRGRPSSNAGRGDELPAVGQ